MEVQKYKTEFKITDILFIEDSKIFKIMYGGNGDLYWCLYDKDDDDIEFSEKCKSFKFYITKEHYEIYEMFNELYNNIKNCKVFEVDEWDLLNCETEEEVQNKYDQIKQMNEDLKLFSNYYLLFHDNIISWHSDDTSYEKANSVDIIKHENQFVLDFNFKEENDIFIGNAIRFRNSGSMYTPFNMVFMNMFKKLQNYDLEYHQTHIEEYIYQKTKK